MTKKQPKNQRIEWRIQFDYIIITSYNDLIWFLSFPFSIFVIKVFPEYNHQTKKKIQWSSNWLDFVFFVFIGKHWIHTAKQERRRTSFFHSFSIRVKKDKDKERKIIIWSWMNNKMILQMIHCIKFFFLLLLLLGF